MVALHATPQCQFLTKLILRGDLAAGNTYNNRGNKSFSPEVGSELFIPGSPRGPAFVLQGSTIFQDYRNSSSPQLLCFYSLSTLVTAAPKDIIWVHYLVPRAPFRSSLGSSSSTSPYWPRLSAPLSYFLWHKSPEVLKRQLIFQ